MTRNRESKEEQEARRQRLREAADRRDAKLAALRESTRPVALGELFRLIEDCRRSDSFVDRHGESWGITYVDAEIFLERLEQLHDQHESET